MKLHRVLLSMICVVAILLALPFSVSAIGFKAEDTYNSVFVVTSGDALGSGFAIGENCIVTNAHVLDDHRNINLTTYSGENYQAYLVGCDDDKDIAVLGVTGVQFTPLKIADFEALNTGDDAYAIGAPKSMAYTLTKGVVSAKERKVGNYTYIQTDAAINEGNSGGPLVNEEGNVIGMNTLKMVDTEGIGLAIPMSAVRAFVQSLNITTNESGNVDQPLVQDVPQQTPDSSEQQTPEQQPEGPDDENLPPRREEQGLPWYVFVLIAALTVSVILNAVLATRLVSRENKTVPVNYDPRERTDFEIDILE